MLRYSLINALLVFLLSSCFDSRRLLVLPPYNNDNSKCKIEENPILFDTLFFTTFKEVYLNFVSSEYKYDILHYYSAGNFEKVERATLTAQGSWILIRDSNKGDSQKETILNVQAAKLKELVGFLDPNEGLGHYLQTCRPDTSSPYYHVYFIRSEKQEILVYFIESGEFEDVEFEEFTNLQKAVDALSYLKKLFSELETD